MKRNLSLVICIFIALIPRVNADTINHYKHVLLQGDTYSAVENPEKSLYYYTMVYHDASAAGNTLYSRIALFKMARMQLWLEQYDEAHKSYQLLSNMPLSKSDRRIAEEGLAKSSQHNVQTITQKLNQLINSDAIDEAYALIKNHANDDDSFTFYLVAGKTMAMSNHPEQSLDYFQKALQISHDDTERCAALFGVAKMQFWLGQLVRAKNTYQQLLTYPLNPTEHELALAGVVKSLAYYNRPRLAYQMIPSDLVITTPELVVAASQATLWANWADITKSLIIDHQPMLQELNVNAPIARDLADVQWQTKNATAPNLLTPLVFYSHDSETFEKKRALTDYTHYWNQIWQSSAGLDYINYTQYKSSKLNAEGFYVRQTVRPTRDIIVSGLLEPIEYKNVSPFQHNTWRPFLWNANASYTPNDYVAFQLLTTREIIETFPAFHDHIIGNQYSASLTLNPFPYVQFNGAYSNLNLSDTNIKNAYSLSSTVLVLPNYGLSATGIYRNFTDKFTSPDYFSPAEYQSGTMLLKLSRKLGPTWHYYLDGGLGRQFIVSRPGAETAASPTYQWGLGITGPISKCLSLNAYYSDAHQPSAFLGSTTYHYQYGVISLNLQI